MKLDIDYSLYLITDDHMSEKSVPEVVKEAIEGGATLVQYRVKSGDTGDMVRGAEAVRNVTDAYDVPLIIDDRIDIMLAVGADGVHVGQSDMPASTARRLIGPDKILGVSARTVEEAVKAEKDGADYLGVGAMFPTATKKDAVPVSMEKLKRILSAVSIPVVAIGGINGKTIPHFEGVPVRGFAVVSAIMADPDPGGAARNLKQIIKDTLKK